MPYDVYRTFSRAIQPRAADPAQAGRGGGGGGASMDFNIPEPDVRGSMQRYMADMPQIDIPRDPAGIYEGMMGPARQEYERGVSTAGLKLQSMAGRGTSYEDLLARYLPGTVAPIAEASAQAGVASQKFAQAGEVAQTEAELTRTQMAAEIAQREQAMKLDRGQFMAELRSRIEMQERELRSRERVALSQARSAEHATQIRANADRERARIVSRAQQETTKYVQTQENYRTRMRMQVFDKYQTRQTDLQATELATRLRGPQAARPRPTPSRPATIGRTTYTPRGFNIGGLDPRAIKMGSKYLTLPSRSR